MILKSITFSELEIRNIFNYNSINAIIQNYWLNVQ